ncbi:ABC transporter substrate-binding protein [Breoghania sp.]|uniref:ABC transporter substrate-binding protein n=1 Tax=Breoghania sp. TaxID=2065378 RepID=UPI002AA86B78|nr:ABC transporter substrate-binding protein [Breoghania sp.]
MRFIIRAAAIAALSIAAAATANAETVRIGTEGAYPPFNYLTPDNELAGFDIEISNALCEEMKVECEFVTQDWEGMIPALLANKYDAIIASMSITDERKKQVDFSNKYYGTLPVIVVPKDSKLTGVTPADLAGATIGAQASTTHSNFAEGTFTDSDVKLYPTAEEYKLDIINGRLDAVIDNRIVMTDWLNSDAGSCCKILGSLKSDPAFYGEGIGIAIRKGDDELREKFNKAIIAIRENGTYKKINDKYFDFDVYGD